jgi:hypothetical protein
MPGTPLVNRSVVFVVYQLTTGIHNHDPPHVRSDLAHSPLQDIGHQYRFDRSNYFTVLKDEVAKWTPSVGQSEGAVKL